MICIYTLRKRYMFGEKMDMDIWNYTKFRKSAILVHPNTFHFFTILYISFLAHITLETTPKNSVCNQLVNRMGWVLVLDQWNYIFNVHLFGSTATLSPILNFSFAKSPIATIFPLNSWPRVIGFVFFVLNSPCRLKWNIA